MRVAILAVGIFGSHAHAADMVAYGLELGRPLAISECARLKMPPLPNYTPPYATVTAPCTKPSSATTGTVAFPIGAGARHAVGGDLGYGLGDGALQVLVVPTAGASVQDDVLADLVSKYGAPTSRSSRQVGNAQGAVVQALRATWALDTLRVEFIGVAGRLDMGSVLIGTPAGVQARLQLLEQTDKSRPL